MPRQIPMKDPLPIRVYLFGRFQIEQGNEPIQLPTRKIEALLAYLVLNPDTHAREKLAALFWGDSSEPEARNSMRNALAVLKNKLGHNLLIADRQTVSINPGHPLWVDVFELESQSSTFFADPALEPDMANLALYKNDLLADFSEEWILPLREHYRSIFLNMLLQITWQLRSKSEYEKAIESARKVLAFDPANERAHQHIMFCHTALGDRNLALRQYEECLRALREELAVEPAAATRALYEWIRQAPAETDPLEAKITNLPIPVTNFIGRKGEMNEIRTLLTSARLLTLTGPGGSGKTRLAIQVGTNLLDSFKDGVWWIDLSALVDNALIAHSIAKSLGVHEVPDQSLEESLAGYLRSRHILLILDNCEHLIEPSAHIAAYLVNRCDQLKILATSRESLNAAGEQIWHVPTMSLPPSQRSSYLDLLLEYEGIRLFVERARAVRSSFSLTEQNASFVTQICSRLDGIPLAIELAAARIKLLTPEEIAIRLDDRFRLLTGGSRTNLPRHQTLQAVMDWSHALLTEKEQRLFRSLAVFSGSWDLEAMETIFSGVHPDKHETLELLSNLVDKSLVIRDGEQDGNSRYRMLETIRQYAQDALHGSGEQAGLQKRHLDYYLNLVESIKPHLGFFLPDHEMMSWLKIVDREHDNLRTALRFCEADASHAEAGLNLAGMLHWFWLAGSHLTEGRDWIHKILAKSSAVSSPVRAQAYLSLGFLACWQGDFASARSSLERSQELFEEMGERPGIAFSLHGLGFAANGLGEHTRAGLLFEKCLNIAREIDDGWLTSFVLHFIAIGSSFQGKYELARSQFEESMQIMKDGKGSLQGAAFSQFHLGRISRLQGDFAMAYTHHAEGTQLFRIMGDKRGLGYSFSGFACLAQAQGEPDRVARLSGAVDSIREHLGSLLEAVLDNEYEQAKISAQKALGEEAYYAAWSGGRGMSLEQAIQFSLGPG